MRILGVDPGSRFLGYGCIDAVGRQLKHVAHGTINLSETKGNALIPLEDRLLLIYQRLSEVIQEFKPQMMAVEKVFFAKNAVSALKLGQARGAVLLTGKIHSLEIFEYSATQMKRAIVGHGQADKEQVAKMIQLIIGHQKFGTWDASDGLALAICHAQLIQSSYHLSAQLSLRETLGKSNKKRYTLAESIGSKALKKTE